MTDDNEDKLQKALNYEKKAYGIRLQKQNPDDPIAAVYSRESEKLMKVDAGTLEIQSGELMHNPDNPELTCCDPLSQEPDRASVNASFGRTDLLGKLDCAAMAIDASNSIQAHNSLEKMLAHQMASCHKMALEVMNEAKNLPDRYNLDANTASVIQSRKLNSANRLMQTFQQAMVTLAKTRTGGKQTVVVQHVQVNDGGQAIVAGGDADGVKGKYE